MRAYFASLVLLVLSIAGATATTVHVPSNTESFAELKKMATRGGSVEPGNSMFFRRLGDDSRMPSLFLPEESLYDRYAACLAATEGLRRIRDRDVAELMRDGSMRRSEIEASEGKKRISDQYTQNSSKVLQALGMSVKQFNELSKQISQNESLKEKVRALQVG